MAARSVIRLSASPMLNPPLPAPWLLPVVFCAGLFLLCGLGYLLRAGLRTRNRVDCWRCGAAKVRSSRPRSTDMLAGMFLLKAYRCGGCLTRFYAFRSFGPAIPDDVPLPALAPVRRSPFRIRVKVIVRLPVPTDWNSAWQLLLAEERGFIVRPPDTRAQKLRTGTRAQY